MKIAIDVSPLSSLSKVRGIGFYLKHLLEALRTYHPENEYLEFTREIPKQVDLVHYPYFDPFSFSLPILRERKTIVTVHDLTPLVLPSLFPVGIKGHVIWEIQKRILATVDGIITDSFSSQKDIARLTGISPKKISVAYLAAAKQFNEIPGPKAHQPLAENVKRKYNLPREFFLYVGDATPNKNLVRLVKAVLQTNSVLVMVGKTLTDPLVPLHHPWTKDVAEVRLYAKNHPEKIQLLGFVDNEALTQLYQKATALVMPSLYEGFGLPVLEGYASGCPVITSDKGSLKEIDTAACIVDAENIESIAEGMKKIAGDKTMQKTLREKGLQEAKKFTWEKTADTTCAAYVRATKGNV